MTKKEEKVLIDTIHYLQELIDNSGMKNKLIKQSKTKTIEIYEEVVRTFSSDKVKEIINISEQKIFKLKTLGCCNSSLTQNCLKLNPNQLSLNEQSMIEALLKDKNIGILPWNHIHSYGERKGLLVMSLGTFYKYAKKLGFKPRYRNEKVYKVEILSPKASYPFQILHMDSTFWRCKNGERVHIHFIQDNFSRKILGGVVESSITSAKVVENLGRAIEEYQLQEKTLELYCDDGPENKKDVDAYLRKNNFKIKKIIANYKTKKSNNIIEAWNKSFKRIVLNRYQPKTAKQMGELLPIMIDYYNNHYLPSLNSLTPNEVAAGKTAEILGKEIKVKRNIEKRLEANRSICCFLKESKDYQNYDCRKNINLSRK